MREHVRQQTAILLRRLAFQVSRGAKNGDADSVHDLRVAIRRLSRCLRVFSQFYPDRSWKKIRTRLSELMQVAGGVRDRDIGLKLLAEAGVGRRSAILAKLEAERRKAGRDLLLELRRWNKRDFSRKWRSRLEL